MTQQQEQLHGLAASIRAAEENEVFDLAGQSAATIEAAVAAAFAKPFSAVGNDGEDDETMIRITLVTGAGKQARQKYDDHAHKAVVTALQGVGYTEDRTASAVMACAGSYKSQHDTAKNLKTVVVYPRIGDGEEEERAGGGGNAEEEALIPENSPGYKLAVASMPTFENIIKSQCPSWSQKKGCLECLEELSKLIQSLDDKLMHGQPLTASEQAFYDVVTQLEEKQAHVRHVSKDQVEQGQITATERELLLEHNAQRLEEAPQNNKLLQRKQLLQSIDPVEPRQLKHHAAISKLQKEAAKLLHLNDNQLLSVNERKMVSRRQEIWDEIAALQESSRGWFEPDDVFAARVKASNDGLERFRSSGHNDNNKKSGGVGKSSAAAANAKLKAGNKAVNKWVLPSDQKGGKKKKASRAAGPGVFDAMRLKQQQQDDDDDDDTGSSSSGGDDDEPSTPGPPVTPKDTSARDPAEKSSKNKKSKKKKKKKKGAKTTAADDDDDDAILASASRSERAVEDPDTAWRRVWRLLQTYVFPVFVALIGWLVGLLFGKSNKQKKPKES